MARPLISALRALAYVEKFAPVGSAERPELMELKSFGLARPQYHCNGWAWRPTAKGYRVLRNTKWNGMSIFRILQVARTQWVRSAEPMRRAS